MESKTPLGKGIKERLQNYSASPDDVVWEHIARELKPKKKRRLLILWWGIPALLLVLIALGQYSQHSKSSISPNNNTTTQTRAKTTNTNVPKNQRKPKSTYSNGAVAASKTVPVKAKQAVTTKVTETPITPLVSPSKSKLATAFATPKQTPSTTKLNPATNQGEHPTASQVKHAIATHTSASKHGLSSGKNATKQRHKSTSAENIPDSLKSDTLAHKPLQPEDAQATTETSKDSVSTSKPLKKWSLYPYISRTQYNGFKKSFSDNNRISYGVYLIFRPANKLSFRSGVSLLNLQQTWTDNSTTFQQKIAYAEIPLELKYKLIDKKITPYVFTGLSYLFVYDATINERGHSTGFSSSNKTDFNQSSLALNAGLGVQTNVFKNLYLTVESGFKYYIAPYRNYEKVLPYTISISAGIEYRF
ncbi:MAG: PorT family protein [Algicola sp.]|nr:PorT family protein [Algicola sp.]